MNAGASTDGLFDSIRIFDCARLFDCAGLAPLTRLRSEIGFRIFMVHPGPERNTARKCWVKSKGRAGRAPLNEQLRFCFKQRPGASKAPG